MMNTEQMLRIIATVLDEDEQPVRKTFVQSMPERNNDGSVDVPYVSLPSNDELESEKK